MGIRSQERHLGLDVDGLLDSGGVCGGSGLALGDGLGEGLLELGQTFGHLLAALLLSLLLQDGSHLSLDHGVEFVPGPVLGGE